MMMRSFFLWQTLFFIASSPAFLKLSVYNLVRRQNVFQETNFSTTQYFPNFEEKCNDNFSRRSFCICFSQVFFEEIGLCVSRKYMFFRIFAFCKNCLIFLYSIRRQLPTRCAFLGLIIVTATSVSSESFLRPEN